MSQLLQRCYSLCGNCVLHSTLLEPFSPTQYWCLIQSIFPFVLAANMSGASVEKQATAQVLEISGFKLKPPMWTSVVGATARNFPHLLEIVPTFEMWC